MFKRKERVKEFAKRQLALILAIVMAFGTFASTGMAISTAHAAPTTVNNYGVNFVNKLVEITANRVPYVWGGWQYNYPNGTSGVDCRGFVRVALRDTYKLDIFNTCGYLVNEAGDPINEKNQVVPYEKRVLVDLAAYNAAGTWQKHVGKRVCVEGNGIHTYYRVFAAGQCGNLSTYEGQYKNNVLDIDFNNSKYSSLIAYACKFPGSIIAHNGHYGVGLGEFHGLDEVLAKYPQLDQQASGSACTSADRMVRWSESSYQYGNQFEPDDLRYWFGKTVFISACSTKSGIRADNFTTTGKTSKPTKNDDLTILLCENEVTVSDVVFTKVDTKNGNILPGATYKIYRDAACTVEVPETEFTTGTTPTVRKLPQGRYYVKEISAPQGYEKSSEIITVDVSGTRVNVTLYDKATDATVFVRKVDAIDGISLNGATLKLYEWNQSANNYETTPLLTLKYNEYTGAYTIDGEYTNSEGDKYADNALHYSKTNVGKFLLKEEESPNGYINSHYEYEYDMLKDGALMLTNDTAIKNHAKLAARILKTDIDGNPLQGAHLKLIYNGVEYEGYTNKNGVLVIDNIPEGPDRSAQLIEIAPPEGYQAIGAYATAEGQKVVLNKGLAPETYEYQDPANPQNMIKTDAFVSYFTVVNVKETAPALPQITTGTIKIKKLDLSYVAEVAPEIFVPTRPLEGAVYGVYTDHECLNLAVDNDGNALKGTTDKNGMIVFDNVPLGVYYVKELWAPEEYSIISKVYPANLLIDYVKNDKVEIEVGVYNFRQTVTLSMQKIDSTTNKGVAGSVYALKNETAIIDPVFNTTINPNTVLGYFITDDDGRIIVDRIGSQKIEIGEEMFPAVEMFDSWSAYVGLPNGKYYFEEQSAPEGYVIDPTPVKIDASWQSNPVSQEMVLPDGTISAYGMLYSAATATHKENRQTVVIDFSKLDALLNNNNTAMWYPELQNYAAAVNNGMAASLKGAKYQLINAEEIVDVTTGINIPADTLLGIYETNAAGKFTATKFTQSEYDGHPIPNGKYYLIEMQPPKGYALNADIIMIDAPWLPLESTEKTISVTSSAADCLLTQNLKINKVDDEGKPIKGVTFELYSVAEILETCNLTVDELPWTNGAVNANGYAPLNRAELQKLIEQYNIAPVKDASDDSSFVTDENGIIVTDQFVYGDYILFEKSTANGYKLTSTASYIQLPWELHENEGSNEDDDNHDDLDNDHISNSHYYIHDVEYTPTSPLEMTVINMVHTTVAIGKYEMVDGQKVPVAGAKLQLLQNGAVVTLQDGTPCEWVTESTSATMDPDGFPMHVIDGLLPGEYTIKEIETPAGYGTSEEYTFEVIPVQKTAETQYFYVENRHTKVEINKIDAESKTPLIGAELAVVDTNGNVVETAKGDKMQWVSDGSAKVFEYVPNGNYQLIEIKAPYGYQKAEPLSFSVLNTTPVSVTMKDARTYGLLSIVKTDADSGDKLAGAEFQVIATERVVDPITQNVIFEKGEIIETLTTDDSGFAKLTNKLPIATYAASGELKPIQYTIIESKPAPGHQYDPSKVNITTQFEYANDTTPIVELPTFDIANEKPTLAGVKTASPDTFHGNKDQYNNVTVVENGSTITYTISVTNIGGADAWNVVIRDFIPANTQYVVGSADNNGIYDEDSNLVYWQIEKIPAGQTAVVTFQVIVDSDVACSIVNTASFVMPSDRPANNNYPNAKDDSLNWNNTNDTVHQIVEFHKTSEVAGGNDKATAVVVSPGDQIVYKLSYTATRDVYGLIISDKLPSGVTYVDGSAMINGQPTNVNYVKESNELIFDAMDIDDETVNITFAVTVDNLKLKATTKYFENQAFATYNIREGETTQTLVSELITHKAHINCVVTKTAEPKTHESAPATPFAFFNNNRYDDVTVLKAGEEVVYTLTASNTSISSIKGLVVQDTVPEGLEYVSHANIDGVQSWYDKDTRTITWLIDELPTEVDIELQFKAIVKEQKSQLIVNTAFYGTDYEIVDDIPVLKESLETNTTVHQVIEFHKWSKVEGGATAETATSVSIGDTIEYVLELKVPERIANVVITDSIPKGLTYVDNSIYIKHGENDEWTLVTDDSVAFVTNDGTSQVVTIKLQDVDEDTCLFKFSTKVNRIPVNTKEFFMNMATVEYDKFTGSDETTRETLESEKVHHRTEVTINGNKNGTIPTFVGEYDEKQNVTVVHDGDKIDYVISLSNTGVTTISSAIVKDAIPEHTKFVSASHDGQFDPVANEVIWNIPLINAGETINLTLTVQCTTDGTAKEIVNTAYYAVPVNPLEIQDNEWIKTDDVIYQTVEFHKDSTVKGGTNAQDAVVVEENDTIVYTLSFTAVDDVHNLVISDNIPVGLVYVDGSAKFNETAIDASVVDNTITFTSVDLNNQTAIFEFAVKVDNLPLGTNRTFANQAFATYLSVVKDGTLETIESNVVTHKTSKDCAVEKHATPTTYEGAADLANNVTVLQKDDTIIYTLTVKNTCFNVLRNIAIVDKVPAGTKYVSHEEVANVDIWYDDATGELTWVVKELATGESIELPFTVQVTEQKAHVIVNNARYESVNYNGEKPALTDNAKTTQDVVHQVIEFHKYSQVEGGNKKTEATAVAIGDRIDYTLHLLTPYEITNVEVMDELPDGLKYIPGSIYMKTGVDGEWEQIDDTDIIQANQGLEAGCVGFGFDIFKAGDYFFKFSVSVNQIPMNTEKFFMNQATLTYDKTHGSGQQDGSLLSEEVHHMTDIKISGVKGSDKDTFVGKYDDRHDVTVVQDGEQITYTIAVTNNGASTIKNVLVKDPIPMFTLFDSADNNGTYNADTHEVLWTVPEIQSGETVELHLVVKCALPGFATDIVNTAYYTVEGNDWLATEDVVYQAVRFSKHSDVHGGTGKDDATVVAVGDRITYIMQFNASSDVYNVTVSDKIPDGLTYINGSAKINGETAFATYAPDTNTVVFESVDINGTRFVFEFDVIVDELALNEDRYYANQATVSYSKQGEEGSIETLTSEIVTHQAFNQCEVNKTATPSTYVGNQQAANNVTALKKGDDIIYSINVKNTGLSELRNLAVKDLIPEGLEYVAHDEFENVTIWYNDDTNEIVWLIRSLAAEESINLTFKCKVIEQKAMSIVNNAQYEIVAPNGDEAPVFTDNPNTTNDVVHQVVEFHKASNVAGGLTIDNAAAVSVGDTIDYVLMFESKHDVTSLEIFDQLPNGLKYIPGSIAIKYNDETEWTAIDDTEILNANQGKEATAIHFEYDKAISGKVYIKFSAKVERIPVNTEKFFMNQANAKYDIFTGMENSEKAELISEEVHHMTDVKITGNKNGKIPTFAGAYDEKNHVTVINDGSEIAYEIVIANNGVSNLTNVYVKDAVPQNTVFVSADNNGQYDEATNEVTWIIDEVKAGESVTLTLNVNCVTNNQAAEIVNTAYYAVPVDINNIQDNEWIQTDSIIYQTVSLVKSTEIDHGADESDAPYVAIGSKFTYKIEFISTNDVYNLILSDKLPAGLTMIPESVKCVLANGEPAVIEEFTITEDNEFVLPAIDCAPAGVTTLTFDVKVEDVKEYDKDYFFINTANATVNTNEGTDTHIDLASNTISHKAIKTNKTDTPALGLEINETLMWSIIAVISTIGMIGFGIYGLTGKKKQK